MKKTALLLFLLVSIGVCQGCVSGLIYQPDRKLYDTPARHGMTYEEVFFPSRDGTSLGGWFLPAVGEPKGTVIHFHGNAQNMSAHFGFVSWLPAEGFNLFVFDYRGYGTSAGKPDRDGVHADSLAALEYIAARPDIDRRRLLVLGQSLGGAIAIAAVGSLPPGGVRAVVAESPFSSYRGIVRDKIGDIPLLSLARVPLSCLLIGDSLSPDGFVAAISPAPLVIIHGTGDRVVPYAHGKRLFDLAREPKELWTIEGGAHTGAFGSPDSPYRRRLVTYFTTLLQGEEEGR